MIIIMIILPFITFLASGLISFYVPSSTKKNMLEFLSWIISILSLGITSIIALFVLLNRVHLGDVLTIKGFNWFVSGSVSVNFDFYFDALTALMFFLVSFISFLVHFYSYFYIDKEDNLSRFLAFLSLFTFSMLLLVSSSNLIQAFVGWEGISLCSYLLIAYWYEENIPNLAAAKAFLINRFADIGFVLGIFTTFALFSSTDFTVIAENAITVSQATFTVLNFEFSTVSLICILFLVAAFAKSAQIGFHIWLPDAMEAPTPVSALLHAATMVTAGIFLLVKLAPIYMLSEISNNIIIIVSSFTILYAAVVACVQTDIKKIIAYSTVSQLGYMFLAVAIQAYNVAIFHLFTHAFFKALLFLAAGSVIHAMKGEQNIKNMGNLWKKIPVTYFCMLIGSLSLIGIPGFSGFYSKEMILNLLYLQSSWKSIAYYSALVSILFTAFYSFRLLYYVFHANENYDVKTVKVHESPVGMLFVLVVLAIFAIAIGKFVFNDFVGQDSIAFWKSLYFQLQDNTLEEMKEKIKYFSLGLILMAFGLCYLLYIRDAKSLQIKNNIPALHKAMFSNFYFDAFYDVVIVKFSKYIAMFLAIFDSNIIDKYLPNFVASTVYRTSRFFNKTQNGLVSSYAIVMVFGLFIILTLCFIFLGIT
ncbi:NADH-quinone oxidoreductase subunit L [Candidatus Hepatincola sp. Pdp]